MTWGESDIATLKRMHAEGYSYSQIGAEIGVTRGAVSGKIDRLGLCVAPLSKRSAPRKSRPRKPKLLSVDRIKPLRTAFSEVPMTEAVDLPPEADGSGVLFFDAAEHHCRWPLNSSANIFEFKFCGVPKLESFPYCGTHCRMAYTAPPVRKRERGFERKAA